MDKNTKNKIDIINQRIREIDYLYHGAALETGISDGELCIWSCLLKGEKEYSQQDLCEILSLSKQTINSIISNLGKKEFVVLEHMPGSRNRKVIRLTQKGREYGEQNVMWIFQAEEKAIEETEPTQVDICIDMLEKYIMNLKKHLDR